MFYMNLFMVKDILLLNEDYEQASINFYQNNSTFCPVNINFIDYISEDIACPKSVNFSMEFSFKKRYEANLNAIKTLLSYIDVENDLFKKIKEFNFNKIILSNNDVNFISKILNDQKENVKRKLWDDVFYGKFYSNGKQSVITAAHDTLLMYSSFVRFLQEMKNDGNIVEIYYD